MNRRFHSKRATVTEAVRSSLDAYEPGARLPGVAELARQYEVSTATAVYAMQALTADGLVVVTRGAAGGYFRTSTPTDKVTDRTDVLLGLAGDLEVGAEALRRIAEVGAAQSGDLLDLFHDPLAAMLNDVSAEEHGALPGSGRLSVQLRRILELHLLPQGSMAVTAQVVLEGPAREPSRKASSAGVPESDVGEPVDRRAKLYVSGVRMRHGRLTIGALDSIEMANT